MHDLVFGTVATGAGSFCPGRDFTPHSDDSQAESYSDPSSENTFLENIDPALLQSESDHLPSGDIEPEVRLI